MSSKISIPAESQKHRKSHNADRFEKISAQREFQTKNESEFFNILSEKVRLLLVEMHPSLPLELMDAATSVTVKRCQGIKISVNKNIENSEGIIDEPEKEQCSVKKKPRRQHLPAKPNVAVGLWSSIRSNIGKDVVRSNVPLCYFEPLSMLQRLAEDFEYTYLLDKAVDCSDPFDRLALVSSFVITAYSSSCSRLTMPFNPLLGETYELDRNDDMGWRLMSEQVLQSPPTSVQYCESQKWKCWKTFTMETILRGYYLKIVQSGWSHLELDSGDLYSWGRIDSTVNGIITGRMRLDNTGNITINDHTNGYKCDLEFVPFDYFNRQDQKRVRGEVTDGENRVRRIIQGNWNDFIEITPVIWHEDQSESNCPTETVWKSSDIPPEIKVYYNFSLFACQLNEPDDSVAPTDSRRRTDMRLMENGLWQEAESLKIQFDYTQQIAPNDRFRIIPVWFKPTKHTVTGLDVYLFNDSYWRAKALSDWSYYPSTIDDGSAC